MAEELKSLIEDGNRMITAIRGEVDGIKQTDTLTEQKLARMEVELAANLKAKQDADLALKALDARLTDLYLELLGSALALILAWASNTARKKWGIENAVKHRDALHSAVMTGARLAVAGRLDAAAALRADPVACAWAGPRR